MTSPEIEVPILQILYPPDGSIPATHVDKVPAIRQHISALAALAGDGRAPKHSRRVLNPDESAALDAKIIELRETPRESDGGWMTWDQISETLGGSISPVAARKRYAAAMKAERDFQKLAEDALARHPGELPLGRELREKGIPEGMQYTTSHHLKPLPSVETILENAKNAAINHEILLPVVESSPNPLNDIKKLRLAIKQSGNPGQLLSEPVRTSSEANELPTDLLTEQDSGDSPPPDHPYPSEEGNPSESPNSSPPLTAPPAPAPLTEAQIDAELIRLRDSGRDHKEIRDAMLLKGVDFGLAELRHRLAVLARKAPPSKAAPHKIDQMILEMVERGAMDHEICVAVERNYHQSFTVMEMRQKIRELQGGAV